jgi:hypothetical protein
MHGALIRIHVLVRRLGSLLQKIEVLKSIPVNADGAFIHKFKCNWDCQSCHLLHLFRNTMRADTTFGSKDGE